MAYESAKHFVPFTLSHRCVLVWTAHIHVMLTARCVYRLHALLSSCFFLLASNSTVVNNNATRNAGSSAAAGHGSYDEGVRLEGAGGAEGQPDHGGGEHDRARERCPGKGGGRERGEVKAPKIVRRTGRDMHFHLIMHDPSSVVDYHIVAAFWKCGTQNRDGASYFCSPARKGGRGSSPSLHVTE